MSVETITDVLQAHGLRAVGRDRWRADCPVCGEGKGKASALSVGVTAEGAVLLHCFRSECDAESICAALGLDIADLFPPQESNARPMRRRRLITAGQALELLHDESQLVALCAGNIFHGLLLTDDDRARCLTAAGRIAYLLGEVRS